MTSIPLINPMDEDSSINSGITTIGVGGGGTYASSIMYDSYISKITNSTISTVNVTVDEITKLREDTKLLRDAFTGFYKLIFNKEPKNFETAIVEINQYLTEKGLDEIVLDKAHKKALKELSEVADQI